MSYPETHTEDHCDKCQKWVGQENLRPINFLYLDRNDKMHKDLSPEIREKGRQGQIKFFGYVKDEPEVEPGFRQYYICKDCKA